MRTYNNKDARQALIDRANNPAIKSKGKRQPKTVTTSFQMQFELSGPQINPRRAAQIKLETKIKEVKDALCKRIDDSIYKYLDSIKSSCNRSVHADFDFAKLHIENVHDCHSLAFWTGMSFIDLNVYPKKRYIEIRDSYFLKHDLEHSLEEKESTLRKLKL